MEWVAVYGAVVSTLAIGWQVYTWWHKRRRDLIVEVRHGLSRRGDQLSVYTPMIDAGDPRGMLFPPAEMDYELLVLVTNRGERPEFIDVIGLRRTGNPVPIVFDPPDEKALQPSRSVQKVFWANQLDIGTEDEFVAFVGLGEQTLDSRPQTLDPALVRMRNETPD